MLNIGTTRRNKTIAAAVAAIAICSQAQAAEMRYPNWYAFEMIALQMNGYIDGNRIKREATPYLDCDYSSRKCLKGYAIDIGRSGIVIFVGALVDGDNRQVELRHLKCYDNFRNCNDYDRGISWKGERVEKPDMPLACVELMRTTGKFNSAKEPCLGYGFKDFRSPDQEVRENARDAASDLGWWRAGVTAHLMQQHLRMNAKIKIEIDRAGVIKSAVDVESGRDQRGAIGLNRLPAPPDSLKGETIALIAEFSQDTRQPFIIIQN